MFVFFLFRLYCIAACYSHSFSSREFVKLMLKSDYADADAFWMYAFVLVLKGTRISHIRPEKYGKMAGRCTGWFIFQFDYSRYYDPKLWSGKHLIDHSSRGKSCKNLYVYFLVHAPPTGIISLMYASRSLLLDSYRAIRTILAKDENVHLSQKQNDYFNENYILHILLNIFYYFFYNIYTALSNFIWRLITIIMKLVECPSSYGKSCWPINYHQMAESQRGDNEG